jgi:hypothetical protein
MQTSLRPQRKSTFFTPSENAGLLLDLEELLNEQLRLLGGASYRQRLEIEDQLAEVRRELECLHFGPSK